MLKRWFALALWKRVLIGLLFGLIVGLSLHYGLGSTSIPSVVDGQPVMQELTGPQRAASIAETWFRPWGDAFVRLIQMVVVPLILTTLVAGVTAMGDPKKLGSLGSKTLALYILTTVIAVVLGLIVGTIVKPGVGVKYQVAGQSDINNVQGKLQAAEEAGTLTERLLNIIPLNPVKALADADVLQIIFFAVIVGVGILMAGEIATPVRQFFESASEVIMRVTMMIMELAPYGVFFLIAWVMASKGISILSNLLWLAFACIVHIVLVYWGLIVKWILRLPIAPFFRGVLDAQGVAFSTASSNATLPVSIACAEKNLGIDKTVAGSVLPLGATINMDGTSIYLGLVALFATQAAGIEVSWSGYVAVALTATLVSIGAAGIPSAGLLLAATVLGVVGIDREQSLMVIAFIFPFDRILDMMRTLTNVTGDLAVACAVAKWENGLDLATYESRDVT
jgi:Na+/H+-dicarboxylate symporter